MMLVHITKRTQDMAQAKLASSVTKHKRPGGAIVCLFIRHSMSMARAVRNTHNSTDNATLDPCCTNMVAVEVRANANNQEN